MAIAFYIPDQNKLLASYSGSNNTNNSSSGTSNNNNNSPNSSSNNSHQTSNSTTMQAQQTPQSEQQAARQPHPQNNSIPTSNSSGPQSATPNFRANITIPLTAYGAGRSNANEANAVGCWELFAQVLCYALGCYRATMLNPAAIQISFEISGSSGEAAGFLTAEPTMSTTTTTTSTTAATSNAATTVSTTPTTSTTTDTSPAANS